MSHCLAELFRLTHDYVRKLRGRGREVSDFIHDQSFAGGVHKIQHVIDRRCQLVDIFAVKRCNESLIEFGQEFVRHLVAAMLNRF